MPETMETVTELTAAAIEAATAPAAELAEKALPAVLDAVTDVATKKSRCTGWIIAGVTAFGVVVTGVGVWYKHRKNKKNKAEKQDVATPDEVAQEPVPTCDAADCAE